MADLLSYITRLDGTFAQVIGMGFEKVISVCLIRFIRAAYRPVERPIHAIFKQKDQFRCALPVDKGAIDGSKIGC